MEERRWCVCIGIFADEQAAKDRVKMAESKGIKATIMDTRHDTENLFGDPIGDLERSICSKLDNLIAAVNQTVACQSNAETEKVQKTKSKITIGKFVAQWIKDHQKTQVGFARELGLTSATLNNLINEKTVPSNATVKLLQFAMADVPAASWENVDIENGFHYPLGFSTPYRRK